MAKISIDEGKITVRLSQRNIRLWRTAIGPDRHPPEYSLWKKVTVNGEDVWLNVVVESDNVHYNSEGVAE